MTSTAITPQKVEGMRQIMNASHRLNTLAEVLPTGLRPQRMIELAIQAMVVNPTIFECEPVSIFTSILGAAQMGLEINPAAGSAYLVPFGRTCQLIIGYQGRKDLAYESGKVASIHADIVRENDDFAFNEGTGEVSHQFSLTDERGRMIGAYAVCKTTMGGQMVGVVPLPELEAMRDKAKGRSPWTNPDHYPGMCRVAAMRKLAKSMPRALFGSKMARAEALETAMEIGQDQGEVIDVPPSAVVDITVKEASTVEDVRQNLRGQDIQPPPPKESEAWADLVEDAPHSDDGVEDPFPATVAVESGVETGVACPHCSTVVKTKRGLTQHINRMHGEASDEQDSPGEPGSSGGDEAEAQGGAEAAAPATENQETQVTPQFLPFALAVSRLNKAIDQTAIDNIAKAVDFHKGRYQNGEYTILGQTADVVSLAMASKTD